MRSKATSWNKPLEDTRILWKVQSLLAKLINFPWKIKPSTLLAKRHLATCTVLMSASQNLHIDLKTCKMSIKSALLHNAIALVEKLATNLKIMGKIHNIDFWSLLVLHLICNNGNFQISDQIEIYTIKMETKSMIKTVKIFTIEIWTNQATGVTHGTLRPMKLSMMSL